MKAMDSHPTNRVQFQLRSLAKPGDDGQFEPLKYFPGHHYTYYHTIRTERTVCGLQLVENARRMYVSQR